MPDKKFPIDFIEITPTASTEILANGGYANPSSIVGLFSMIGGTMLNLNSTMSSDDVQALINLIKKDLGGNTLSLKFADGNYSLFSSAILIDGFFNGKIEISGNTEDEDIQTAHTDQAVSLPFGINFLNCDCSVKVYNLSIFVFDSVNTPGINALGGRLSIDISGCYFHSIGKTSGNNGVYVNGSNSSVKYSIFSGMNNGIYAINGAKVQCVGNESYATYPDYGIYLGSGSFYYKEGSVIEGLISDVYENGGVFVPVHSHVVDQFTLSSQDILDKYINLSHTPYSESEVDVSVAGAPVLINGVDFLVSLSPPTIYWTGTPIDGVLAEGDTVIIRYIYK